ncbi:MAG: DUF2029 domain-containing protein [Thaumarchaeota archaeon]|nr:DUF2029 domain-containing protein [Nitrososphaerota archaeon]
MSAEIGSLIIDANGVFQDLAIWVVLVAFSILLLVLSRLLPTKIFLAISSAVYVILAAPTGQRYDVYFLYSSGIRFLEGINPFYSGNPSMFPGALKWAYPPGYVPYSSLSFLLYSIITKTPIPSNSSLTYPGFFANPYEVWETFIPSSLPILVLILKVPMILSAFAIFYILSKKIGTRAASTFWLANPFVIFISSIWGQIDPIATAFAVGSVYLASRDRYGTAYFFAGLGAIIKIWPAILIPLIFLKRLKKGDAGLKHSLREILWILPSILFSVLIYGINGSLVQSIFVLVYARGVPTYAGEFSVNGLTWQQVLPLFHSPPIPVFLFVGIPAFVLVAVLAYKKELSIEELTLVLLLFVFLSYNYVNPQYFYWLIPFFLLIKRNIQAILYSVLPVVFITLAYNILYFVSPVFVYDVNASPLGQIEQAKVAQFYGNSIHPVAISGVVSSIFYSISLFLVIKRYSGVRRLFRKMNALKILNLRSKNSQ